MIAATTTLLFLLILFTILIGADSENDWRLIASEIDAETLSIISRSPINHEYASRNDTSVIWQQEYSRIRELASYYDESTKKPYVIFNGGGSTSIYKYDIKESTIITVVDGSTTDDKSFGRMIAIPDQDLLLVVDVSRYQIVTYSISSGRLLAIHSPFDSMEEDECNPPRGLTFISPAVTTTTTDGQIEYFAWNQGARCLLKVTLTKTNQTNMSYHLVALLKQYSVYGDIVPQITDVVQDQAEKTHILLSSCDVMLLNQERYYGQTLFSLEITVSLFLYPRRSHCHQMTYDVDTQLYLITIPEIKTILVVNNPTGVYSRSLLPSSIEQLYSISISSWNRDIVLIGGGVSIYAANMSSILFDNITTTTTTTTTWSDIITSREYPIPDLSRIIQQPEELGGGFYVTSGSDGFIIESTSSNPTVYHLVKITSQADMFSSIDAVGYFPNTRCQKRHIGTLTSAQIHLYAAGISHSRVDNMLYEITANGSKKLLYNTGTQIIRILSLDHHPFYSILCIGLSNGNFVCLDTNQNRELGKFSIGPGSRVASLIWDCERSNHLYIADNGKNRILDYEMTSTVTSSGIYDLSFSIEREYSLNDMGYVVKSLVQDPIYYFVYVLLQGQSDTVGILNKTSYLGTSNQIQRGAIFPGRFSNLFFQNTAIVHSSSSATPLMKISNDSDNLFSELFETTPTTTTQSSSPPSPTTTLELTLVSSTRPDFPPTSSPLPLQTTVTLTQSLTPTSPSPLPSSPRSTSPPPPSTTTITQSPIPSTSLPLSTQPQKEGNVTLDASKEPTTTQNFSFPILTEDNNKLAVEPKTEESISNVLLFCLFMIGCALAVLIAYAVYRHVRNVRHENEWNRTTRGTVVIDSQSSDSAARRAAAKAFSSREVVEDENGHSLSIIPLQLPPYQKHHPSSEDEDDRVSPLSRIAEDSNTSSSLTRLLKTLGIGSRNNNKRASTLSTTNTSGLVIYDRQRQLDTTSFTVGSIVDSAPSMTRGVIPLKPITIGSGNQGSDPNSSPDPETPPVRILAGNVPDAKTAASIYSASMDDSKSKFIGGAVVSINRETGEMEEELNLGNATSEDDDDEEKAERRSLTPKQSTADGIGTKVSRFIEKTISSIRPFKSNSEAKQK